MGKCASCTGGGRVPSVSSAAAAMVSQDASSTTSAKGKKRNETEILLGKVAMCGTLAYMMYIGATCPCDPLYRCHLSEMYLAVLAVVLILVYFNGLTVKSVAHK